MNQSPINPCEVFEASLSALIDGELEVPEQLPTVDHLLECDSCRKFYNRARALGDMLTESRSQGGEAAPEGLWERIAAESGVAGGAEARKHRRRRWMLQLAATALLGTGLWLAWPALRSTSEGPSIRNASEETPITEEAAPATIVLEENRGSMSDERFVELATELLRADRRYHRQMLEVMSVVTEVTQRTEGSVDERPLSENVQRISIGDGDDDGDGSFRWSGDSL